MKKRVYWIAFVLILGFIWGQSLLPTQISAKESGDLALLLSRLFGGIDENLLRKLAHVFEFTLLGMCLGLLFRQSYRKAFSYGGLMALLDETMQLFSGRGSKIADVWIDCIGVAAGVGIICGIRAIRNARLQRAVKKDPRDEGTKIP